MEAYAPPRLDKMAAAVAFTFPDGSLLVGWWLEDVDATEDVDEDDDNEGEMMLDEVDNEVDGFVVLWYGL